MRTAGYSGTPLAKKLGIKDNFIIKIVNPPVHYFDLFSEMPMNVKQINDRKTKKNLIHFFVTEIAKLKAEIPVLKKQIEPNGCIWVSWPKKTSNIFTEVGESEIRDFALSNGLVDIKVCAVDEIWSGLKLVIRVKDRQKAG
jgi:hypothetical protein